MPFDFEQRDDGNGGSNPHFDDFITAVGVGITEGFRQLDELHKVTHIKFCPDCVFAGHSIGQVLVSIHRDIYNLGIAGVDKENAKAKTIKEFTRLLDELYTELF